MKTFTSKTQKIGERGEDAAATFLITKGYIIEARNVANTRGEIDIIAKKGNTYYFFEVKAGIQGSWFNPAENLTKEKLRKFLLSVGYYCLTKGIRSYKVMAILVKLPSGEKGENQIEMIDIT